MDIELRQHKDGSYILEVRDVTGVKEIDVSGVIREIFLEKLSKLQDRLRLEERYRNLVIEEAQNNQSTLASALTRYSAVVDRLTQTNEYALTIVESWQNQKDLKIPAKRLIDIVTQNQHFLKNNPLSKMVEDLKKEKK